MLEINDFVATGAIVGEVKKKIGEEGKPNIASFDIGIKYKKTDERASNYRVVTFGDVADDVIKNMAENDRIIVRGKIKQSKFQAKNGSEMTSWQIVASSVELLSKGVAGRIKPDIDDDYDF